MKELSIEEKAKRYDEAIEVAQRFYNNSVAVTKKGLEDIFPELMESEDKRMRAMAIKAVYAPEAQSCIKSWGINPDDVIAWLEKQGEQKPAEEYNITGIGSKNAQGKLGEMIKNLKPVNLVLKLDSAWSEKYIADVFEKVGLAKIAREQSNDSLTNALQDAMIELSKFTPQPKQEWSEEDEDNMMMIEDRLSDYLDYIREDTSLTKHQKNSMKEEVIGYVNWLKSLKDRVQSQPKQEWSEEDEKVLDGVITNYESGYLPSVEKRDEIIEKLKSLKERYTWKPSDEQIYWIKWVAYRLPNTEKSNKAKTVLEELLEQLNKL